MTIVSFVAIAVAVAACGGSTPGSGVSKEQPKTTTAIGQPPTSTPTATATPALPTADPFYRWSGSLTRDPPGTILRTRTIAFAEGGEKAPIKSATQLLYATTDELGHRTVSVVTVLRPVSPTRSPGIRLVSYETSYDALGSQCDPSYAIQAGTLGQTGLLLGYVDAGTTVIMPDYEGENLAYGAGQQNGYETLDAIRAAETAIGVPETSTPVGLLGYSGGSIATEFASELAPTYAPNLDIVGVAEGGVPVDFFHNLVYVDRRGSKWTWVIPAVLEGLARGFGIRHLDRYFTPQGVATAHADQTKCAGDFAGLTTQQLLKRQYEDMTKVPAFVRLFDKLIMSDTGTPRGPLLIENGRSDSIGDGVMVARDVQELAYIYCGRRVPVEFHIRNWLDHSSAGGPFFKDADRFLAQRFAKQPFKNGCAEIRPGNRITHVPVPEPR